MNMRGVMNRFGGAVPGQQGGGGLGQFAGLGQQGMGNRNGMPSPGMGGGGGGGMGAASAAFMGDVGKYGKIANALPEWWQQQIAPRQLQAFMQDQFNASLNGGGQMGGGNRNMPQQGGGQGPGPQMQGAGNMSPGPAGGMPTRPGGMPNMPTPGSQGTLPQSAMAQAMMNRAMMPMQRPPMPMQGQMGMPQMPIPQINGLGLVPNSPAPMPQQQPIPQMNMPGVMPQQSQIPMLNSTYGAGMPFGGFGMPQFRY